MQSRLLSAIVLAALVVTPLCAQKKGHGSGHSGAHGFSGHSAGSGPNGLETMSGYHSSAGYGSAYGWGYNDWTRNGWHNGQWHGIPYSDDSSRESSNSWQGSPYRNTSAYYPYWGGGYWYPWRDASGLGFGSPYNGPHRPVEDYSSYGSTYAPQPSMKRGGSSSTYASPDEIQLIQQQVARRRAQQAQQNLQPQLTMPDASPQKP